MSPSRDRYEAVFADDLEFFQSRGHEIMSSGRMVPLFLFFGFLIDRSLLIDLPIRNNLMDGPVQVTFVLFSVLFTVLVHSLVLLTLSDVADELSACSIDRSDPQTPIDRF